MTIVRSQVDAGLQQWAVQQRRTLDLINRALAITQRDRPGVARTAEDLAARLLLAAAHRHEAHVAAQLRAVDEPLARLLDDLDAIRLDAAQRRSPQLHAADLRVMSEALDSFLPFEEAVRVMTAADAGELQQTLVEELRAGIAAARAADRARPPTPARPRRAARRGARRTPEAPTPRSLGDRDRLVRADAEGILAAYERGETFEPYGRRPYPVRREDPGLSRQMAALQRARNDYAQAEGDPVRAEAALERFQRVAAESEEALRRSAVEVFETAPAADPVPPKRRLIGPPERGSPDARRLDAESRIRALDAAVRRPASLGAARLFDALHFAEVESWASGVLGEPLRRSGTEGKLLSASAIRDLQTAPPWLAEVLARHLEGYQRAHMVGAGFGAEVLAGLMLAPEGVNQVAQNRIVEQFLRRAAAAAPGHVEVYITAKGRRLLIPLANATSEYVDVMTSIHYEIHLPERRPVDRFEYVPPGPLLEFEIAVQPDGRWSITRNDLPAEAFRGAVPTHGYR